MIKRKQTALAAAIPSNGSPARGSLKRGRIMIMGTMARSCTINIPTITRLDRVPIRPWFSSVFNRTMVLDNDIKAPNHMECIHGQPIK